MTSPSADDGKKASAEPTPAAARTEGLEAESADASPFLVRCHACGAPADFDVRTHFYKCAHCGATTDASSPLKSLEGWRKSARKGLEASLSTSPAAVCTCPSCGAVVAVNEGEMSATCAFCGGTMARRAATGDDAVPEVVIPFVLSRDDAQKRLDRWLELHGKDRCAAKVREHRGRLKAMFLPYRLVKGPVRCTVTRQETKRTYQCGAYVNGTAINASGNLPNEVLDAMEPFDWNEARAFHWGYLSGGQTARFPDVSGEEMEKRAIAELEEDCRPMVERTLMTTGVSVKADMGDEAMDMPALLPVYVITAKGFRCFVNGQTGRVAVSDGSMDSHTNRWWLPAVILTPIFAWLYWAFAAAGHVYVLEGPEKAPIFETLLKYLGPFGQPTLFSAETMGMLMRQGVMWLSPLVFLAVLLLIFKKNRAVAKRLHIAVTPPCSASRKGDGVTLVVAEGQEAVQDSVSARPVFFEDDPSATGPASSRQGKSGTSRKADGGSPAAGDSEASDYWASLNVVPVSYRFYTTRRIVRWGLQAILSIFLPVIVCVGLNLTLGVPYFPPTLLACQFIWVMFIIPWSMSNLVKGIAVQVFDNPAIQRIRPDGTLVWMDKGKEASVLEWLFMLIPPLHYVFRKSWAIGLLCIPTFLTTPLLVAVAPIVDEIGGNSLEQTAHKGVSRGLMEYLFAHSHDLTKEEWDALPPVGSVQFMEVATQSLINLGNSSSIKYERIKRRIQDELGQYGSLKLSNTLGEGTISVNIPATPGHGSKVVYGKAVDSPSPTLRMNVFDASIDIPEDRRALVVDYLAAVQGALPWGGFSLAGKKGKHVLFTSGTSIHGLKRIPPQWSELVTMWPLDVMETVEGRVGDIAVGKTDDTTVDQKQMKRISRDFWEMATMDGKTFKDVTPDVTPSQILEGFQAFLDGKGMTTYEVKDGVLYKDGYLTRGVYSWVTVDSVAHGRSVILKGRLSANQVKAMDRTRRLALRNAVIDYNNLGGVRFSMDLESGDINVSELLPLRFLKTVPEDFYDEHFYNLVNAMKVMVQLVEKEAGGAS